MFNCTENNQFVPISKVCDRVPDCMNNYDEMVCGSCNFANKKDCGYKHWYNGMLNLSY